MDQVLTRRLAGLRSAAVAALAGLALVQVIELPATLAQARQVAAFSGLAAAGCIALALALAAARTSAGAAAWRALAAVGGLALGGWALSRAVAVPGVSPGAGRWTAGPGLATAGLGVACVALAAAGSGARPTRAAAACIAKACALVAALVPAAGVLLVALGPGPSGGESAISEAATESAHVHGSAAVETSFRPGFGGHAGHYIYPNATPPHLPPLALALAVAAAALFTYLAAGSLRRRSSASPRPAGARSIASGALPRAVATVLLLVVVLAAAASKASAHATLLRSDPPAAGHLAARPGHVTLTFSEPVQILRPADVSVVDGRGRPVAGGVPRVDPGDARVVTIALRAGLLPDSYTVRYRVISADSHDVDDALVFVLGDGRLRAPVLRGTGGASETGPWAVGARFAELTALGLLLGLLAFRSLVWGPALEAARHLRPGEREAALAAGARMYWRAFWGCAAAAGLAEGCVLAAKSAVVLHTSFATALQDPAGALRLVAASRFGDLLGWRSGLLLAIVALAFWEWARESGAGAGAHRAAGRARPSAAIGLLSLGTLAMLSVQGHASQAPLAPLSVLADAVHLGAAGIWIGGLACVSALLLRAPVALPRGGRRLATLVVARFSRVALVAVALIVATGLLRLSGELSRADELWSTDYGRSVLMKMLLLCPLALLAMRNRRAIRALAVSATGVAPRGAMVRALRRNARVEVAIGLNIVLIAALLVAQIPGRDAPSPARAKSPPVARAAAAAAGHG